MPTNKINDAAISELTLSLALLVRRLRSAAPAETQDLSWTQKAVLRRLEKEGLLTSAELARAEGIKPQSMGAAIASLEELGFVERKPHPTDGRQYNIKLTSKGAALRKNLQEAKHVWLSAAIEKLTKQEQSTLFAASDVIKKLVEP